ncbi:MAG: GNAT family N-acetyltransferase [Chitinophagaceae bacterium]|nr:GNAT family N-acetyltransferase [Chitinophagaceae bacterium]
MIITKATLADTPQLVTLLNSAYRGEASTQGWTTEAHLIAGDVRSTDTSVNEVLLEPGSVILKCVNDAHEIAGTVNLQKHHHKLYLGMFAVAPAMQGGGIGKRLLEAAEVHAKEVGCSTIYMTVVSVRTELIDWYKRHGYIDTGERKPFHEDGVTGRHLQPLEFAVLEKTI